MQSFSQMVKVYGRSGASEIFDLLNTRAFFASPSHEMAQLVSKELGEEDVEDTRENYSYGANSIRDGISLGKTRITRPIVTYPEVMGLDPLTCYLRLPGHLPITKLTMQYQKRSEVATAFTPRKVEFNDTYFKPESTSDTDETSSDGRLEIQAENVTKKQKLEIESILD